MSAPDTVMVLAVSYPDVASAEADYEAVKALYHEIRTSHDFDAAVISRDEDGKVHSSRSTSSRRATARHTCSAGTGGGRRVHDLSGRLGQLRVPAIERQPNLSRTKPSRHVTARPKLKRDRLPEKRSRPPNRA
jgi:hypothetical protein